MPDICDLVLDDHERFRRRFAELDDKRAAAARPEELIALWDPLAGMLETHASAEEELLYPRLLHQGANAEEEADDALHDHNEIRAAIRRAAAEEAGSERWWEAVLDARSANSDHIAEEERESLPDFREHVDPGARDELGARWLAYGEEHAGGRGLSLDEKDPAAYLQDHK